MTHVRAEDYDTAFEEHARRGEDVHGEAAFVESLGVRSILDAGCGTGRVAIELARRGLEVVGVDVDAAMLGVARAKAPDLEWILGDLATVRVVAPDGGLRHFDAAVMAGNVMLFVEPATEASVVANVAEHVRPGGLLVTGFQLNAGRLTIADFDAMCDCAGLTVRERWSTWDRARWQPGRGYAVSVLVRTEACRGASLRQHG